jgi:hypothetical protein
MKRPNDDGGNGLNGRPDHATHSPSVSITATSMPSIDVPLISPITRNDSATVVSPLCASLRDHGCRYDDG